MLFDDGLVISLPAVDMRDIQITGSVFDKRALAAANLSDSLRSALSLILEPLPPRAPLFFVARPEIFTEGETLKWFALRCRGVVDHLCISDGSAIRLIPGLRNHVFFYGLNRNQDSEALSRLERRVPELFMQLQSQVNTAFKFRWKGQTHVPEINVVCRDEPLEYAQVQLRRLYINRQSIDDSAARMLQAPLVGLEGLRLRSLLYIRLTESGLRATRLVERLGAWIAQCLVDPTKGVVFVLPKMKDVSSSLSDRLRALAAGLLSGKGRLPAASAPNMLVATADLPVEALSAIANVTRLVVDDLRRFLAQRIVVLRSVRRGDDVRAPLASQHGRVSPNVARGLRTSYEGGMAARARRTMFHAVRRAPRGRSLSPSA